MKKQQAQETNKKSTKTATSDNLQNKENITTSAPVVSSPKRNFVQDIDVKKIREEVMNSPHRKALLELTERQEQREQKQQEKYREMKENPKAHLAKFRKRMEERRVLKK